MVALHGEDDDVCVEYRDGDDLRRIHRPATARTGDPEVPGGPSHGDAPRAPGRPNPPRRDPRPRIGSFGVGDHCGRVGVHLLTRSDRPCLSAGSVTDAPQRRPHGWTTSSRRSPSPSPRERTHLRAEPVRGGRPDRGWRDARERPRSALREKRSPSPGCALVVPRPSHSSADLGDRYPMYPQ